MGGLQIGTLKDGGRADCTRANEPLIQRAGSLRGSDIHTDFDADFDWGLKQVFSAYFFFQVDGIVI